MKTRHFLMLFAVVICGMSRADEKIVESVKHVDAAAAEKLIKDGAVTVIDVRTSDEYKQAHIAGAKNVDFIEDDFEKKISELDKSKSYLVHCASGNRSGNSLEIFKKLGFKSIYHLDNGLKGWEAAGKPVVK